MHQVGATLVVCGLLTAMASLVADHRLSSIQASRVECVASVVVALLNFSIFLPLDLNVQFTFISLVFVHFTVN